MNLPVVVYGVCIATNAVFTNVVGDLRREVERYGLPITFPLPAEDLAQFSYWDDDTALRLKSGWLLDLKSHRLVTFNAPEYAARRTRAGPDEKCTVELAEALAIARRFVALSGLPTNETWIHLKPEIQKPTIHSEPYYDFTWYQPNEEDTASLGIAVDCRDGSVIHASFSCLRGRLAAEHSATAPPEADLPPAHWATNAPPARELEAKLLKSITEQLRKWARQLDLPAGLCEEGRVRDNVSQWARSLGGPERWQTMIRTPDGWQLGFVNGKLFCWVAPDAFFGVEPMPDLARVSGKWRLSEAKAIELARRTVRRLDLRHEGLKVVLRQPRVLRPNIRGGAVVPRYYLEWTEVKPAPNGMRYFNSIVEAEVDADKKKVRQLIIYLYEEGDPRLVTAPSLK